LGICLGWGKKSEWYCLIAVSRPREDFKSCRIRREKGIVASITG
jgi:hypothetical protein